PEALDRERPRDPAAPVVPDERDALRSRGVDEPGDVGGELVDAVLAHTDRARGPAVAAEIRRPHSKPEAREVRDLVPPRERRLRKAVEQEHELVALPCRRDVEAQAVRRNRL